MYAISVSPFSSFFLSNLTDLLSFSPQRTQTATAKNSLGIVEYTPNSYVPSDLDKFFSAYKPEMVGSRPILKAASGGVIDSIIQGENFNNNLESNLDLQYAMALTYPLRTTLYQVGDNYLGGSFNTLCVSNMCWSLGRCADLFSVQPRCYRRIVLLGRYSWYGPSVSRRPCGRLQRPQDVRSFHSYLCYLDLLRLREFGKVMLYLEHTNDVCLIP